MEIFTPPIEEVLETVEMLLTCVQLYNDNGGDAKWREALEQQAQIIQNDLVRLSENERASYIGAIKQRIGQREDYSTICAMLNFVPVSCAFDSILAQVRYLKEARIQDWQKGKQSHDSSYWLDRVKEIFKDAGRLSGSEIEIILQEVERKPDPLAAKCRIELKKIWRASRREEGKAILSGRAAVSDPDRPRTWPYSIKDGRIVVLTERIYGDNITTQSTPVCDFTGYIAEQITDEGGERTFTVIGKAVRGGHFKLEIAAEDFGNDRKLKAVIDAASGGMDPVRAGMGRHIGPALKLLTTQKMKDLKRFKRTGWADGRFLISGREGPKTIIQLPRKLPYKIDANANLELGLKALEFLLESIDPERSTVLLASIFQAPLMRLATWENERYAVFVAGRTGSFKTSICQVAMSVYGYGFMQDELLIKWGEGATSNAMMGLATSAHDMPFLIDNFKPSTGGDNIVEGGEKDRMNRASQLRETKPIFCQPICTGEDVPDSDAASLVRILVLPFLWQRGEQNPNLTLAQKLAGHLSAVGNTWIEWLESKESKEIVNSISAQFDKRREYWSSFLTAIRYDTVNANRVASNLATNELTWRVLCEHPDIKILAQKYKQKHIDGLTDIVSAAMAEATAESLEATRYLEALKELLATGRVILREKDSIHPLTENELQYEKDRHIGWFDKDAVYLLPSLARRAVENLLTLGGLNQVSNAALYKQLDEMKLIASRGKNQVARVVYIEGKSRRVLVLKPKAVESEQE
jgi:hypothetical protein